jgi:hypothetical protein
MHFSRAELAAANSCPSFGTPILRLVAATAPARNEDRGRSVRESVSSGVIFCSIEPSGVSKQSSHSNSKSVEDPVLTALSFVTGSQQER